MATDLTEAEYQRFLGGFRHCAERSLAAYARKLLLGGPVKILAHNRSADLLIEELAVLRKELNALGNNFSQVVKQINSVPDLPQMLRWLETAKRLQQQLLIYVTNIQSKINQVSEQWYANS